MEDARQVAEALERLTRAIEATQEAERRADSRVALAEATIEDAKARIDDAEAQVAHADSHMEAAKKHMAAAEAYMDDADERKVQASNAQLRADQLAAETAAELAQENDDSAEYQRALYHYQQLVRHRIANPLQIIKGMAHTLLNQKGIPVKQRREMLKLIAQQAEVLEGLALFAPDIQSEEERELHPKPFQ